MFFSIHIFGNFQNKKINSCKYRNVDYNSIEVHEILRNGEIMQKFE